jgi:hypothetical protein
LKTIHAVRVVGVGKSRTFSTHISPLRTLATSKYASPKVLEKKSQSANIMSRREVATKYFRERAAPADDNSQFWRRTSRFARLVECLAQQRGISAAFLVSNEHFTTVYRKFLYLLCYRKDKNDMER